MGEGLARGVFCTGTLPALPPGVILALFVVMVPALLFGLAGPPARRPHPLAGPFLVASGIAIDSLGAVTFAVGLPRPSLMALGLIVIAVAAWMLRASQPDGGDEEDAGGGRYRGPDAPWSGPGAGGIAWDWDEFDRLREGWRAVGEQLDVTVGGPRL